MLEHTHATLHTRHATPRYATPRYATLRLLYIDPRPMLSVMDEPFTVGVGAPVNLIIELRVRPFVLLLSHNEASDSASFDQRQRFEPKKFTGFVAQNLSFHVFNSPAAHSAMFGPVLVAFALFMLFPVFTLPFVSADTFP